jgi:hypothetical protein
MTRKREVELLQQFMVNNYELERLESTLNEFNPLNVLKVDNYEIRHSNILSWLLNPKENHRLDDSFLRKFLAEIIVNNDSLETKLNVFNIQEFIFSEIEIKREWSDIDILLIDKRNKFVLFIENKIRAKESKGQLKKYHNRIDDNFQGFEKIPVFLTLFGDNPSDIRYGILSYVKILEILRFILEINSEYLNEKIVDFINYYIRTLELLTMEDKELKELCKKIYKEHKEAIDLIAEYANENSFEEAAKEFANQMDFTEFSANGRGLWTIPKVISENVERVAEEKWVWGYPLTVWFAVRGGKMGVILEVGPFLDANLRSEFLKHLRNYGFSINEKSLLSTAKYTRIFSKYPVFDDWDNKESIVQKLTELYNKHLKKSLDNVVNACKAFNWK